MTRVAIAGGSSGIGKAIGEAIKKRGQWDVVILGRNSTPDGATIAVNYDDIDQLKTTLETYEIHTVICAISFQHADSSKNQLNLIRAADQASCTKRFMPSEFGAIYKPEHTVSLPLYAGKFEAIDLLEKTGLEYTRFSNGMFMDYWFDPYIPSAFSSNVPSWVDLANNFAAIPGDGKQPLVLTHSCDVGKFVAAALELDKWETRLCLVGDRITINEFLRIAEDVKGVQFEKHYDTMEMLEAGKCTLAPALLATLPPGFDAGMITPLIAGAGKRVTLGEMDIPTEGSLNQRFPELETFKVKDAVKLWFERQSKSGG